MVRKEYRYCQQNGTNIDIKESNIIQLSIQGKPGTEISINSKKQGIVNVVLGRVGFLEYDNIAVTEIVGGGPASIKSNSYILVDYLVYEPYNGNSGDITENGLILCGNNKARESVMKHTEEL